MPAFTSSSMMVSPATNTLLEDQRMTPREPAVIF
jgi:hypothetical protein